MLALAKTMINKAVEIWRDCYREIDEFGIVKLTEVKNGIYDNSEISEDFSGLLFVMSNE